jgi:flavin reductase
VPLRAKNVVGRWRKREDATLNARHEDGICRIPDSYACTSAVCATSQRTKWEVSLSQTAEPSPQVADPALLRGAFGAFATGVTVVTVGGKFPHGMTANAFTSLSLNPPLLLVCIGRDAIMHGRLGSAHAFGISVLASHQEDIARHFANRRREQRATESAVVRWLPGPLTGVPLIHGALAHFECELWRTYEGGDHSIFIGRLLTLHRGNGSDALLFYRGRFHQTQYAPR